MKRLFMAIKKVASPLIAVAILGFLIFNYNETVEIRRDINGINWSVSGSYGIESEISDIESNVKEITSNLGYDFTYTNLKSDIDNIQSQLNGIESKLINISSQLLFLDIPSDMENEIRDIQNKVDRLINITMMLNWDK